MSAGPNTSGVEGSGITLNGSANDPDSTPTLTWTYTNGPGIDAGATCTFSVVLRSAATTQITCTDDGQYNATLTADDGVNPAGVQHRQRDRGATPTRPC